MGKIRTFHRTIKKKMQEALYAELFQYFNQIGLLDGEAYGGLPYAMHIGAGFIDFSKKYLIVDFDRHEFYRVRVSILRIIKSEREKEHDLELQIDCSNSNDVPPSIEKVIQDYGLRKGQHKFKRQQQDDYWRGDVYEKVGSRST